jgi:hypothetical protein
MVINVLVCKVVRSFRSNFFLFIHLRGHGSASPKVQMIFFTSNKKKEVEYYFFLFLTKKNWKGFSKLTCMLQDSGIPSDTGQGRWKIPIHIRDLVAIIFFDN